MVRVSMIIQCKLNFHHFDIVAFPEFYLNHTITLFRPSKSKMNHLHFEEYLVNNTSGNHI